MTAGHGTSVLQKLEMELSHNSTTYLSHISHRVWLACGNDRHDHIYRPISLWTVPFKSVGGVRNGRFFAGGEGPNSELLYPIRLYMHVYNFWQEGGRGRLQPVLQSDTDTLGQG